MLEIGPKILRFYLSYISILLRQFSISQIWKKKGEIMPVKTVISPSSAPQVTFRQAIRGVSNENGLCLACVAGV